MYKALAFILGAVATVLVSSYLVLVYATSIVESLAFGVATGLVITFLLGNQERNMKKFRNRKLVIVCLQDQVYSAT